MLIVDEIQAGIGGTGKWWACEDYGVTPDAMTMAKGIGGAGLPLGGMVYHEKYDKWDAGGHIGTFRGNIPAKRCGIAAIEYIQAHDLLDHATELGKKCDPDSETSGVRTSAWCAARGCSSARSSSTTTTLTRNWSRRSESGTT